MNNNNIICPICTLSTHTFMRYKDAVCDDCIEDNDILDSMGYTVEFENRDFFGGFAAIHYNNNGGYFVDDDHICFIKGNKFYADEARFGGIVILPIPQGS